MYKIRKLYGKLLCHLFGHGGHEVFMISHKYSGKVCVRCGEKTHA
jgi:Prophage protein (DUF1660)